MAKKLDHLDRDVIEAQRLGYGTRYGDFKADHPHTRYAGEDSPAPLDDGVEVRTCEYCGETFLTTRLYQKYCCEEHRLLRAMEKEKERRKNRPPLEKRKGKPAVCAYCGAGFESIRNAKYCCKDCYIEAQRRQTMERNRKRMETKKANGTT